jgi:hypothetical protein
MNSNSSLYLLSSVGLIRAVWVSFGKAPKWYSAF